MSTNQVHADTTSTMITTSPAAAGRLDLKLEAVVIPVADVDHRGTFTIVVTTASAGNRVGALASFFVVGYVGLSLPVVGRRHRPAARHLQGHAPGPEHRRNCRNARGVPVPVAAPNHATRCVRRRILMGLSAN